MTHTTTDDLLAHSGWMRSFCRDLVRDVHLAEDVAQDTWLAALRRGPRSPGALPGWLRTVARNFARQGFRRPTHLSGAELSAEGEEQAPSPADALERAELRRLLVEAVLALEEPYRSTVVLHHFEELSIERVAQVQEVTASTVRTRLQRAREQLRERLERGGHHDWVACAVAVAWGGRKAATTVAATGTMLKLAVGLVVVMGLSLLAWRGTKEGSTAPPPNLDQPPASHVALQSTDEKPSGTTVPAEFEPASTRELVPPTDAPPSRKSLAEGEAEIRGRFLLEGGTPAAGLPVEMRGWGRNHDAELRHGVPEDWASPTATTDANGRFSLRFDPPRAFQFTIDFHAPGHARAGWRWSQILVGEVKDLGEVVLLRGGSVDGRLVNGQGVPLTEADWRITAMPPAHDPTGGRDSAWVYAQVDPATGEFHFEDLPPGRITLWARGTMGRKIRGAVVVAKDETTTCDLVFDGPDTSRRIVVRTFCEQFFVMNDPDPNHVKLHVPGMEARTAEQKGGVQTYVFDDVDPGTYTVSIDDPRYGPWEKHGVSPGEEVWAYLEGNSALALTVLDEATGDPVTDYRLRLKFRNVTFKPNEFEVHDGAESLPGGLLTGVFPGDYTLSVRTEDHGWQGVEIEGLQRNETRDVQVVLGDTTVLEVQVVHPDGAPVPGVDVRLATPAEVNDSPTSPFMNRYTRGSHEETYRHEVDARETDADGRCEFELIRTGDYAIVARHGLDIRIGSEVVHLDRGQRRALQLVLPRGGTITGTLSVPTGTSPDGMQVEVVPAVQLDRTETMGFRRRNRTVLSVDGNFSFGPLPAGRTELLLIMSQGSTMFRSYSSNGRVKGAITLGMVDVAEGQTVHRDFTIGDEAPVRTMVRVNAPGTTVAGARLTLSGFDDANRSMGTEGVLDDQGRFGSQLVYPGRWTVRILGADEGWRYEHPTPIEVTPGAPNDIELQVLLVRGTVRLLDHASGAPLADRRFVLSAATGWAFGDRVLTSNDVGEIEVTLQSGTYRLALVTTPPTDEPSPQDLVPDETRTVELLWSAVGPATTDLHL